MRFLAPILLLLILTSCASYADWYELRKKGVNYYVKAKTDKPYTGDWREYEGKVLIAKGTIAEGHQVVRYEYYRSGELSKEIRYRQGVEDVTTFYKSGQKMMETLHDEDEKPAKTTKWWENGQLQFERIPGSWKSWHQDGTLESECNVTDPAKKLVRCKEYDTTGKLVNDTEKVMHHLNSNDLK